MLKKLGLTGIVLSILLLNGCGTENKKDDSFKSSSTADVIIDNQSTQTISTIYIKTTTSSDYGNNILATHIASNTEKVISTSLCDKQVDIKILSTTHHEVTFKNKVLPCGKTSTVMVTN
ncbi:MAG TPA: hypothetical protein EYG80_06450 [Flavobacteriaceae bacterium]|nr:hypothetical protein [Flavobacteriaceae bacterium]